MFMGQTTSFLCSGMFARLAVCICLVKMLCVYCETTEEPFGCSTITVLAQLLEKQFKMETKMEDMLEKEKKMQAQIKDIENQFEDFKCSQAADAAAIPGMGSIYTRWGRNVCGEESSLIYSGYTAGKKHNGKGSGSNPLCLPTDPTWSNFTDGNDYARGTIFGSEIDIEEPNKVFWDSVNNQDVPCAVCRSSRATALMIPARNNCYPGWKLEYQGYIMSEYQDHPSPHSYMCVDAQPDFVPNGSGNNNDNILYLVEAQCGSLPCPPYVQGRELACVVCSR